MYATSISHLYVLYGKTDMRTSRSNCYYSCNYMYCNKHALSHTNTDYLSVPYLLQPASHILH